MNLDISKHPCFNQEVKNQFGRIHLPVAPRCNIQCNFCNRKYDCVNESRPGVSSGVLSPRQALFYLKKMMERDDRIAVVGIAGPGDPFANSQETIETLELVRSEYPEILLCVSTNGLEASSYIKKLTHFNLTHLTVTINAVDPEIGRYVYAWARDGKKIYRGTDAAALLIQRQFETIRLCKEHGITVKINSIVIPGINEDHMPAIARNVADTGADLFNCIPLLPVEGTPLATAGSIACGKLEVIRSKTKEFMPQMTHCTRCRADAVGCLGDKVPGGAIKLLREVAAGPLDPEEQRPYVAVASMEGMLVNEHLGRAKFLWIYGKTEDGYELIETRQTPPGGGDARWRQLGGILRDCRAVLVSAAGKKPEDILNKTGLRIERVEGLISEALGHMYEGRDLRQLMPARKCRGCSQSTGGCG